MTPQEYEDTHHYIIRNISDISEFAKGIMGSMDFINDLGQYGDELDFWHAYGERVDLNFTYRNDSVVCYAYPVVNAMPNYDNVWAVEIPLDGNTSEFCHDHVWFATDSPGLCACECGVGRTYNRGTDSYEYWDGTEYSCDHCGKYTDNGGGHYLDELGSDDRVCQSCYEKAMK